MTRTTRVSALFLVAMCSFGGASQGVTITFNSFTNPHPPFPGTQGTVGFAYAGNKFVGSVLLNGAGSLYSTDLNGGNVQAFAPTVSLNSATQEHFVAASFGLGGFAAGDVWAADGSNIVHISNSGAASNTFVSGLTGDVRGITFDLVGTFSNNMLVTTTSGNVYRVNSAGTPTLLANVGEDVEGLDVAPLGNNFGTFDGQLIVASEGSGQIRAISNGGVVTPLSNGGSSGGPVLVPSAEELTFVPLNLGVSGSPLEGLYGANYTADVLKASGSQFLGLQGDIIVTGETTGKVNRIHWDSPSGQFQVSQVGAFPNQPEDGIFVTPTMVFQSPEPSTFVLCGFGLIGLVAVIRRKRATARPE